ncbi:uncharacterized protein IUM83_09666 [Phytophthora cinnamomi]|uniref:uncharacterized protein n=1 Tax=Phytophthora cinnamomi TaxID=4785 RepID=UPI00355A3FE4|nr:hypothetical protein IUM83_09666 [Phytophthora cinnamomi]
MEMAVELFAIFNIQKGEQTEDQEQRYFSPDGKLSILKSSVNDFLGDQGIFVINVADGLEAAASDKVLENIGVCMLNLAESLTDLSTTSLEEGGVAGLATEDVDLPPVLPQDLARLSGRDFTALLKQHKGLMHVCFSEEELSNLDREYQAFHRAATRDAEMKKALAQCHKESPFVQTWALTKGRYPLLQAFAGGLASSYAVRDFDCKKSPVDVSLGGDVTEDADVLRLAATDFGLETKLHARQLDALGRLSDTDCASG